MRNLFIFICLIGFSYSCTFSGKLTKRYKRIRLINSRTDIKDFIDVNAGFFRPDDAPILPAPRRLTADLPEDALAELIKQLGTKEPTSEKIIAQLSTEIGKRSAVTEEFIDMTVIPRRILVSIMDLAQNNVNRVSKIEVRIKFPSELRLLSCNRFETAFATIDLGKLNFSNSIAAKGTASLTAGLTGGLTGVSSTKNTDTSKPTDSNTVVAETTNSSTTTSQQTSGQGLSAEVSGTKSFSEEVQLRQRIIALTASVDNSTNTLKLFQEGIGGIKLDGNVTADVTIDTKANTTVERTFAFADLVTPTGFNTADKLKVTDILIAYLNRSGNIMADITFYAEYRQVYKGHKTITESDDYIDLKYGATDGTTKKSVVLLYENEYKPHFWIISSKGTTVPELRLFSPTAGDSGSLLFNSFANAKSFLTWLKSQKTAILSGRVPVKRVAIGTGGHFLELQSGREFTAAVIDGLEANLLR